MSYATLEDIQNRYDADALFAAAGQDENGELDSVGIELALADASAEIDTYLAVRHTLPLATTPPVLARLAVDIALYKLPAERVAATDKQRERYDDALKLLAALAAGKASLGLTESATTAPGADYQGGTRIFTRTSLRGM